MTRKPKADPRSWVEPPKEGLKGASRSMAEELDGIDRGGGRLGKTISNEGGL